MTASRLASRAVPMTSQVALVVISARRVDIAFRCAACARGEWWAPARTAYPSTAPAPLAP